MAVHRWPSVLFLLIAMVGSGCSANGLAFRDDDRVDITSPRDREMVVAPVTVGWNTEGLTLGEPGGPARFAVFVDRAPIRAGQSLRAMGDDDCRRRPTCPDDDYLRERYVFLTRATSLTLETLPAKSSATRTGARDSHDLTIVLVDASGRRHGEAAWHVEFRSEQG